MATATKKRSKQHTPEEIIGAYDDSELSVHEQLRSDPILFAEKICGIEPHNKQAEFLRLHVWKNYRVMLPWGRQFGKSISTSVLIAYCLFAFKNFRVYLFAPSGDQTKQIFDNVVSIFQTSPYLKQFCKTNIKGDTLKVGGPEWGSFVELVRVGLTGDLGRGRSSKGVGKSLIVFDEFSQFLYPEQVLGALTPIIAAGGGQILLSSPGDPGSAMHRIYEDWKEQSKTNPRYRVIDCDWRDTEHITQEWVDDQQRHHSSMGTTWIFEREILGKWVAPANTWFAHEDIQRCLEPNLTRGNTKDVYVWGCDPGGRGKDSAFVITIARLNQSINRLEVVDVRSFKFENHKYRTKKDGSETIQEYDQIIEICCDLRNQFPPVWFGIDPNTERSLAEQLEKLQFPISEICVGGYSQKLTFLEDLKRAIAEKRIVWNDPRITRQLQNFCPRRDEHTQRWKFPEANADIIITLGQLYRYLGEREFTPFAVSVGKRIDGDLW